MQTLPKRRDRSKDEHPSNCMSWPKLNRFAEWVGARLPTEAEWELAARGGDRDVIYPWGDHSPTCDRVNYASRDKKIGVCKGGTSAVCRHPTGDSWDDLSDMARNVCEWVQDEYHPNYNDAQLTEVPGVKTTAPLLVLVRHYEAQSVSCVGGLGVPSRPILSSRTVALVRCRMN